MSWGVAVRRMRGVSMGVYSGGSSAKVTVRMEVGSSGSVRRLRLGFSLSV